MARRLPTLTQDGNRAFGAGVDRETSRELDELDSAAMYG